MHSGEAEHRVASLRRAAADEADDKKRVVSRLCVASCSRAWLARSLALAVCVACVSGGQFHPNKSTSFINEEQLFKVEYLDDASLTGFVAEDIVQLGDYYVSTRFGCVTKSKGHDWAQADGILGMGFPAAALRSVPFPLFWALTDQTKVQLDSSNILMNRIFTLMLSQDRGELVLGGHDPASVKVQFPLICRSRTMPSLHPPACMHVPAHVRPRA